MLAVLLPVCQTESPCGDGLFAPCRAHLSFLGQAVQTGTCPHATVDVTLPVLIWFLIAAGVATVLVVALRQNAPRRRARAVRDLLDAADALEARLRTARAEIEAVAGEQGPDPVGDAMREMLRQRLWLRDHGREASLQQLAEVRHSIDAARGRIETQLAKIAQARAPQT